MAGRKTRKLAKLSAHWNARRNKTMVKMQARLEDKLPVQEKEIISSASYEANSQKARQNRKHRHIKKESFEWNKAGSDSNQRIRNISRGRYGNHKPKVDFCFEEGVMAIIGTDRFADDPHCEHLHKGMPVLVTRINEKKGTCSVLSNGQTVEVRWQMLRPLNYDFSEEED
jgi:hypothetical protein|tara:strand:+ start:80 stop:589 length:510 start_codon:yes stop_codon:yes gene_type:complete